MIKSKDDMIIVDLSPSIDKEQTHLGNGGLD
jgi:hypothetical protein